MGTTRLSRASFGTAHKQWYDVHRIASGLGHPVKIGEAFVTEVSFRLGPEGHSWRQGLASRLTEGLELPTGLRLLRGSAAFAQRPIDWLLADPVKQLIHAPVELKSPDAATHRTECLSCKEPLTQYDAYAAAHVRDCGLLLAGWELVAAPLHLWVSPWSMWSAMPRKSAPDDPASAAARWTLLEATHVLTDPAPTDDAATLLNLAAAALFGGGVVRYEGAPLFGVDLRNLPPHPGVSVSPHSRSLRSQLCRIGGNNGWHVTSHRGDPDGWDADLVFRDPHSGRRLGINTRPKTIVGWYTPEPGAPLPPGADRDVDADGNECATLNFGRRTDVPAVIDAVSHVLTLAGSPRISSVESRLKGTPFAAVPDASHLRMPSMAR